MRPMSDLPCGTRLGSCLWVSTAKRHQVVLEPKVEALDILEILVQDPQLVDGHVGHGLRIAGRGRVRDRRSWAPCCGRDSSRRSW